MVSHLKGGCINFLEGGDNMTVYNLFYLICIAIMVIGSIAQIAEYIEKKIKNKHRHPDKD